ncbi:hypothetical protein BJ944DRAFT_229729 [Cunninghamella echinulata]|nr:hypothetical protein BJ944DRAFT_229729 [Cunninghamella echinulata]
MIYLKFIVVFIVFNIYVLAVKDCDMYHARACNGFGKGKVGPICSCNTNKTMKECFVKPGQRILVSRMLIKLSVIKDIFCLNLLPYIHFPRVLTSALFFLSQKISFLSNL